MELELLYHDYYQLLQLKFGKDYPNIIGHSLAVAKLSYDFCIKGKVHPAVLDRAVKLALIHDLGKKEWLQDRSLNDYEATRAALRSIPAEYFPNDINYIIYLLKYLNYDVLNSASIMSFPVEVLIVAYADLHTIEANTVSIDERREYLKQKYFSKNSPDCFESFWEKRVSFVNKFNSYFEGLKIPQDPNSIISLSIYTGGWLYEGEYELLLKAASLALNTHSNYVEVGSWRGKSTVLIASSLSGTGLTLFCVDNWQGGTDTDCNRLAKSFDMKAEFAINTKMFEDHIQPVVGLSTDQQVIDSLPQQIGFIFFDGAHDYKTVNQEIDIYSPMLVEGGVMCFHDTDNPKYPGVRKAIDEKISPNMSFIGQSSYLSVYQKTH